MYMITVDIDKCQACEDCISTCPNELFTMVEEDGRRYAQATGDPDECIGCMSCEGICPEGAITVTEM